MGLNTDDGFIIESRSLRGGDLSAAGGQRVLRWIALAADAEEALSLLHRDLPDGWDHNVVDSGLEIRAQAARLELVPGSYQRA